MIVQCPACRALVTVSTLVKLDDEDGVARVGVPCVECGATSPLVVDDARPREGSSERARPSTPSRTPGVESSVTETSRESASAQSDGAPAPTSTSLAPSIASALARVLDDADRALTSAEPDARREIGRIRTQIVDGLHALGERWESKDAHKVVVGEAARQGELAFLGQCYRAITLARPDDKGAVVGRDLVLAHAMATMSATSGDGDQLQATAKKVRAVAMVLGALALAATLAFLVKSVGATIAEFGLDGAPSSDTHE